MQREIQHNAYETQKQIESGEEIIVGLNKFQIDEEVNPDVLKVDEELEQTQVENLKKIRQKRNEGKVNKVLADIRKYDKYEDTNMIQYILEAVKAYATVGEIRNVLRDEFG